MRFLLHDAENALEHTSNGLGSPDPPATADGDFQESATGTLQYMPATPSAHQQPRAFI